MDKNKLSSLLGFFILLNLVLAGVYLRDHFPKANQSGSYPELAEIKSLPGKLEVVEKYFKDLADKKGARYAFAVMIHSEIPGNLDMHLLGHALGDKLYEQEGLGGITACTDDFRNACSHSIVIGLFLDKGEQALPEIAEACHKAPGGSGAYMMCFHGLGHGILASVGYDMEKAVQLCEKTGSRETGECVGGMVMEITGGGFHDRQLWTEQRKKYLDPSEPASLCQRSFISATARPFCLAYITPYLLEAAGADLGNPGPEDFRKAFKFCAQMSASDKVGRNLCAGGFGKEFVVLVRGRDIRKESFTRITDKQLTTVSDWCSLAADGDDAKACILSAVNSLFWGGENDRSVAIRFCTSVPNEADRSACLENLIGAVGFYISDPSYRKNFCGEIPASYQEKCRSNLQIN